MFLRFRFPAFGMLLFAIACGDHNDPTDAASGPTPTAPPPAVGRVSGSEQAQVRNERLARRFAMALQDDGFRKTVFDAIHASQFREHKVHLQRFVRANPEARPRLARASGDAEADIQRDLNSAPQIEIYFPVKEHLAKWEGDLHILVATALRDADTPVAFDPAGHRILLDPKGPPATPVIALGHAELDFDHPPTENLLGGGGGGGGPAPPPGLYMTSANFYSGIRDREGKLAVAVA